MAHSSQAERALPQVPTYPIAAVGAAVAALVVAAIIAFGAIDPFGLQQPLVEGPSPAVLDAGNRWEAERRQQSGVDPLIDSQREWLRQRLQQMGASN